MGGRLARLASIIGGLIVAAAPCAAAAATTGCKLYRLAELPVTMEGLQPVIPVTINGQPGRFIVDSGAFFSMVTPRAAEKFKLNLAALPTGFYLQGAVGTAEAQLGTAKTFTFEKQNFTHVHFLVAGDTLGADADGLLGQNVLGVLDVEYDLANGVVRIFKSEGCERAMLAYWAQDPTSVSIVSIPAYTPLEPHILSRAMVNDLPIRVEFDTGAGRSVLKLSAAVKAGGKLTDDAASADDSMRGIGRRSTDSYTVPFASFEIGGETIRNVRLNVAKVDFPGADMLIGADFFLSHRVFVARSQRQLFFTYNGGPVFRLDDAGVRSNLFRAPAAAEDKTAQPGGAGAAPPLDADALRRRAAAEAARHDFPHALADLDQAIALSPGDPELYYDRARWRLAAHTPPAGDLEKALQLKPDYVDALVLRAHLDLMAGAVAKADADFEAAAKAAPDRPDTELEIAKDYIWVRRYERALARLDAWLVKYPQSFSVGQALNLRCSVRALWGRDLDLALADCNQALRRGSRLADVLDTRGLVHLRRGELELAISDYDAALKLQPRSAPSLYGRGLAKRKVGDAAGAAADLQAAGAVDPDIAAKMTSLGITEAAVVIAQAH